MASMQMPRIPKFTRGFSRPKKYYLILIYVVIATLFVSFIYFRHRLYSFVTWNTVSNDSITSNSGPTTQAATSDEAEAECIRDFLSQYEKYCSARLKPSAYLLKSRQENNTQLCPCIPSDLVGFVQIPPNDTVPSFEELDSEFPDVKENGRWYPSGCVARQRLAIIIPYADREKHLRTFLSHMHPILQRQLLDYSIFVIEQLYPELFNRAMLMNVGFAEANGTAEFDCFIFHDIDQLPINDRNFYTCSDFPRHVVGYRKKFNYYYAYSTSFAGGNSFTRREFELINGFSNLFYGWGGEDDDLYQRTEAKMLKRTRYPRCIAKYDEVVHLRDKRNPLGVNQELGFKFRPNVYKTDGLSSLNYTVVSTQRNKLFTKISVHLPPPPPGSSKITACLFLLVGLTICYIGFGFCSESNKARTKSHSALRCCYDIGYQATNLLKAAAGRRVIRGRSVQQKGISHDINVK